MGAKKLEVTDNLTIFGVLSDSPEIHYEHLGDEFRDFSAIPIWLGHCEHNSRHGLHCMAEFECKTCGRKFWRTEHRESHYSQRPECGYGLTDAETDSAQFIPPEENNVGEPGSGEDDDGLETPSTGTRKAPRIGSADGDSDDQAWAGEPMSSATSAPAIGSPPDVASRIHSASDNDHEHAAGEEARPSEPLKPETFRHFANMSSFLLGTTLKMSGVSKRCVNQTASA